MRAQPVGRGPEFNPVRADYSPEKAATRRILERHQPTIVPKESREEKIKKLAEKMFGGDLKKAEAFARGAELAALGDSKD